MSNSDLSRLHSRPHPNEEFDSAPKGLRKLGVDSIRDGLLFVPESYSPETRVPLIVMLHGAGGHAAQGMKAFRDLADRSGSLLLVPESRRETWDLVLGSFGPDVRFLDEALDDIFALYNVDPKRLAIGGFSDGASYALSLGLSNGGLWSHVLAFSPGFESPTTIENPPAVFISHGTRDHVLPIATCSRRIVPQLRLAGVDVTYVEFEGSHTIPPEIARNAFSWMLGMPIPEVAETATHASVAAPE